MRKSLPIILSFLLTISFALTSKAQVYQQGQIDFRLGATFLRNNPMIFPVDFRAEYGIHKFLSAGVYFSYSPQIKKDWWYSWIDGEFVNRWTHHMYPGACATVHISEIGGVKEKLNLPTSMELYSTVFVGAYLGKVTVPGDPLAPAFPLKRKLKGGWIIGGAYEFSAPLSVYVEAGYGPSGSLSGGILYRLRK